MTTTTGRIIDRAIRALKAGADPIDAIEAACAAVATTPAQRDRARRFYLDLLARAERAA